MADVPWLDSAGLLTYIVILVLESLLGMAVILFVVLIINLAWFGFMNSCSY